MAAFWCKKTSNSTIPLQADLTPVQVTVSSIGENKVYNMEFKQIETVTKTTSHNRENSFSSSSSSSSTFAAANVMAGFQNHSRRSSRRHGRNASSESQAVSIRSISEDSMWDDWIVKFIEDKKTVVVDDSPMEDWIFETM